MSPEATGEIPGQQGISFGTGGRSQNMFTELVFSTEHGDHCRRELHLWILAAQMSTAAPLKMGLEQVDVQKG